MNHQTRHSIENPAFAQKAYESSLKSFQTGLLSLKDRPENWGFFSNRAAELYGQADFFQQKKHITLDILRVMMETSIGNYRLLENPGKKIELSLLGRKFSLTGNGKAAFTGTSTWLRAYFSAIILRDQAALLQLANVPLKLLDKGGITSDPIDYALVNFYKSIFISDSPLGKLFVKAIEATEPSQLSPKRARFVSEIVFPALNMLRFLFPPDGKKYEMAMEKALHLHKKYYSEPQLRQKSEGMISLPLTAIAVLANDSKKMDLSLSSDYLPTWLIKNEFD